MTHFIETLASSKFSPLLDSLRNLRSQPPQVLLLEGGTRDERIAVAHWWTAGLHCTEADAPCGNCRTCRQIDSDEYCDMLAFDGRISNKEDEENPGAVRAFNMTNMRGLKATLRDAPHGSVKRVVLLSGIDRSRIEAANALLKVLEEPSRTSLFVMEAPQREQLLPTLVSRSWTITLPWPATDTRLAEYAEWEDALAAFAESGTGGWLDRTARKGALTPEIAEYVLLACTKATSAVIRGNTDFSPLARVIARLSAEKISMFTEYCTSAQEGMLDSVNPARTLDWLAVQLYGLTHNITTSG